jgi:uncharacterized protein (UPF0332 family)
VLEQERIDLAKHRLVTALDDYNAALSLFGDGHYKAANNRAYYCIFHAIRAILALEGKDFKKHSALIGHFNQYYVRAGVFKKEHAKIVAQASTIRNASDYDDFYIADKAETQVQIEAAKIFYNVVEQYLNGQFNAV